MQSTQANHAGMPRGTAMAACQDIAHRVDIDRAFNATDIGHQIFCHHLHPQYPHAWAASRMLAQGCTAYAVTRHDVDARVARPQPDDDLFDELFERC